MGKEIRILLVDDHQVVRDGLRSMLAEEPDMEVVGDSSDSEDVLAKIAECSPNVILMDIKMPRVDGIQLAYMVKQKYPDCNVVMLTLYSEYLPQAMGAGAKGYLLKDTSREELIQAIRQVSRGEVVISKNIAPRPQIEYKQTIIGNEESLLRQTDSPDTMVEEIQLVLPTPVEANQVIRFTAKVEEMLQPRILQVVGAWREGTAVTAILPKAITLAEIMIKLRGIAGVDVTEEAPLRWGNHPTFIKKVLTIPGTKSRQRKTIFIDFKITGASQHRG